LKSQDASNTKRVCVEYKTDILGFEPKKRLFRGVCFTFNFPYFHGTAHPHTHTHTHTHTCTHSCGLSCVPPEGKSKKEKGAPIQRSTETGMAVELSRSMSRQPSRESNNGSMNSYNSEGKSVTRNRTSPRLPSCPQPSTLSSS